MTFLWPTWDELQNSEGRNEICKRVWDWNKNSSSNREYLNKIRYNNEF